MLLSCVVSREVSTLFVLVTSGEARGPGLQSRRGGNVNILNLNQNWILCAQRTLNYEAKIKSEFIKRLTFLQSSQFLFWRVIVMTRPMHQDV